MDKLHWINVKMELQGVSNEVKREIVIPDFFSFYYLHILIAALFNFDDLADVQIANEVVQLNINNNDEDFNEQIFDAIKMFMPKGKETTFTYAYMGRDTWDVLLTLSPTEKQYQHITCLNAIGNGIFFDQVTKEEYEKTFQYHQCPQSPEAQQFFQDFPDLQDLNFTQADLADIQYKLSLLERNLLDAEDGLLPHEDMESATDMEPMPLLDAVFDTNSFLMHLYHEVAGLSIDQAAYEILYRTNVGNIIDTMKALGYDERAIDDTLQAQLAFDEQVYEKVADSVDLLHMLPQRKEVFSEDEERYLEQIDEVIFSVLGKHHLDTADLSNIDDHTEEQVSKQLIEQITKLKNQHLS